MSDRTKAAKENWAGRIFANNWEIIEKYNCRESLELGLGGRNVHYLVKNRNCGIETYMERTSIGRYLKDPSKTCMRFCQGCKDGNKRNSCHYSTAVRKKNLTKEIDRTPKVKVGETYGAFSVLAIRPSGNYADHQCRASIKCKYCGAEQERRFDQILNCSVSCECFKNHSSGEKIVREWLIQHNIMHKTEEPFPGLVGLGGKPLRYDFAIINKEKVPIKLIEVDGSQHFEEAGSYYNPNGYVQIHDNLKNDFAKDNSLPLLRITYDQLLMLDKIIPEFLS